MQFKFEPNLAYQLDAIKSVVSLFDGANKTRSSERIFGEVSPNILKITDVEVSKNKEKLYELNKISDPQNSSDSDFSIEMETGTGKTYVYIRTIYELYKSYGLAKFVIVTPSTAVREGVLKTLQVTENHFFDLYSTKANYIEYNSKRAQSDLRNFVETNQLSILVINSQAFTGDTKIINAEGRDSTHGKKLIDLIAKTRPIIILDEPQEGMDASKTGEAIASFKPLFKLRYSATHKLVKNLIYRLNPYDAYNQGLVKKIEVFSVVAESGDSAANISFVDVVTSGGAPKVKLELQVKQAGGIKAKTINVADKQDLRKLTNNPIYDGWRVENIGGGLSGDWKIRFSNGQELTLGEKKGWDKEAIFEQQLLWTIKKHFEKKDRLSKKGIKVLSLLFIDKVDNYIHQDSMLRTLFEKLYAQEYKNRYGNKPDDSTAVHEGYFSRTSSDEYTDNANSMSKNKEIYDLILKDKERLLSNDNPVEFIFSHSALGVGWDNPNIFQICTLNETQSVIQKRQEIGRGLRICVNQAGERVRDNETVNEGAEINLLTVVANQSYESFVEQYQTELADDYGNDISGKVKPRNARRKKNKVKLREDIFTGQDFRKLWEKINSQTRCDIVFSENVLVEKCVSKLDELDIAKPTILLGLDQLVAIADGEIEERVVGTERVEVSIVHQELDIVDELSEATSLSHPTVIKILSSMKNKNKVVANPADFLQKATTAINRVIEMELVHIVRYEPTGRQYLATEFEKVTETYNDTVKVNRGLYDAIIKDSDIEGEFAGELDSTPQVKLFLKLPNWYKIPIPNGSTYNPDWAMVIQKSNLEGEEGSDYYFVIETKGAANIDDLTPEEQFKIHCAIKHFEAIGLKEFVAPVKPHTNFKQDVNKKVPNLL